MSLQFKGWLSTKAKRPNTTTGNTQNNDGVFGLECSSSSTVVAYHSWCESFLLSLQTQTQQVSCHKTCTPSASSPNSPLFQGLSLSHSSSVQLLFLSFGPPSFLPSFVFSPFFTSSFYGKKKLFFFCTLHLQFHDMPVNP